MSAARREKIERSTQRHGDHAGQPTGHFCWDERQPWVPQTWILGLSHSSLRYETTREVTQPLSVQLQHKYLFFEELHDSISGFIYNLPNRHITPCTLTCKPWCSGSIVSNIEGFRFTFPLSHAAVEFLSPFITPLPDMFPPQSVHDLDKSFTGALPGNFFCNAPCSASQCSRASKLAHTPSAVIPCSLLNMAHVLRAKLASTYSQLDLGVDRMELPLPTETALAWSSNASRKKIHDTTSARPTTLATCNQMHKLSILNTNASESGPQYGSKRTTSVWTLWTANREAANAGHFDFPPRMTLHTNRKRIEATQCMSTLTKW